MCAVELPSKFGLPREMLPHAATDCLACPSGAFRALIAACNVLKLAVHTEIGKLVWNTPELHRRLNFPGNLRRGLEPLASIYFYIRQFFSLTELSS